MKYSNNNKPLVCMQTNSTCYKKTSEMIVQGVLWHSTGANNPNLKRYVQPSSNDVNYSELIVKLGKNTAGNDWNHVERQAGLNAWIGKLADGTVASVQTMPWNYKPWGCGGGNKGSCNNGWIQFEICEDSLTDQSYFNKVYQEACELTAYLCTLYNLDPKGTVVYNGVEVPVILCHQDSYLLKLGNNHGDVYHWFKKFGKTMDDVRNDVANLMGKKSEVITSPVKPSTPSASTEIEIGDTVRLTPDAKYVSGKSIPSWVFKSTLYVRDIRNNGDVVISTLKTGAVTGVVSSKYILKDGQTVNAKPDVSTFTPYKVKVTVDDLNIRFGPGTEYKIVGCIKDHGTYTIVEESNNWGHLKSGAGWIHLGYTKKV